MEHTYEPRAWEGDFVRVDGELHRVIRQEFFPGSCTYFLSNGGCCGDSDITEVLLESEV